MLPYIKAGRWAVRSIHPFLNITVSFHFGMISADLNGGGGDEDHNDEERALIAEWYVHVFWLNKAYLAAENSDPKRLKIYVNHYNRMLDSVIGFRNGILEFADDISELQPLLSQVCSILDYTCTLHISDSGHNLL
jgi:hypothetical protein